MSLKSVGIKAGKLLHNSGGIRRTLITNRYRYDFREDASVYFQVNENTVRFECCESLASSIGKTLEATQVEVESKFRELALVILCHRGFQHTLEVEICFEIPQSAA